jgi:hypothetical protein
MSFDTVTASRNTCLFERVLFLDGLGGTGKTMMGPILSSFRRVETQRMDHVHEFVCALHFLGRMTEDAAVVMSRMYGDIALYNAMIARESNFRPTDLSGVLKNPRRWTYVRRLFAPDGDAVLPRLQRERPILHIHSHQMLGIAGPVFRAFGPALRVVEMVRHPLSLVPFFSTWIERFAHDARDFNVWFDYRGHVLPWWARGWEEKFLASRPMDRVIYLIERLTHLAESALVALDDETRARVIVVPFEKFVVEPWSHLRRIEAALETTMTPGTRRVLRREKVPRQHSGAGRDLPIYRRYAWEAPPPGSTEPEELRRRRELAARDASAEALAVLDAMSAAYEARYLEGTAA